MRRFFIAILLLPTIAIAQNRVVSNVASVIENEYVGAIDYDGAAADLIARCDPYSSYISSNQAQQLARYKAGKNYSTGITANVINDSVAVVTMVDYNSPAYGASIKAGDTIKGYKVNGDEVSFWSNGRDVKLTKRSFNVYAVSKVDVIGDVGYIKFDNFYYHASDSLAKAYKGLKDRGIKGLVVDLRDNGGGELSECIKVASMFMRRNILLSYTKGKKRAYNGDVYTVRGGNDEHIRLVFIVGARSASAAEMLVGAMQDYKRGSVIGQRTYGKSVAQKLVNVGLGAYVNITVAEFFTPLTSRSFTHKNGGLSVDVVIDGQYADCDLLKDKAVEAACQILKR